MTASKYTPGPWSIQYGMRGEDGPYHPGIDSDATDFTIILWGEEFEEAGIRGRTPEEARANARLIAAAPDLLEALEVVRKQARHPDYEWPMDLQREVDAAIAKATGASHE